MTNAAPTQPHDACWYEIRVQGRLDPRWSTYLDGVQVRPDGDGTTVLTGHVIDQAALHGLLAGVRDLGLPLISVARLDPDHDTHHRHDTPHRPGTHPHHDTTGDPT